MDLLKDWWVDWRIDWPFIEYSGKAKAFQSDYQRTLPTFFADLAATDPEIRRKYYAEELYDLLLTMVIHRDMASIRKLFDLCRDWNGCGHIEGLTPLGQALDNRDLTCMEFLLEKGADPGNYDQSTTVLEAAVYDRLGARVYDLLLSYGAVLTRTAVLDLARDGEEESIRALLAGASCFQYDSRAGLLDAALEEAEEQAQAELWEPEVPALIRKLQETC